MVFQHEHVDRYEQTAGADGHELQPDLCTLIMTTVGRKTGRDRKVATIYRRVGDNYVVVASRGGAPTHPNWYLNLLAHPEITIQVGAVRIPVRARTAEGAERKWLWPLMVETFPTFDDDQANSTRILPIVILEPIHDPMVTERTTSHEVESQGASGRGSGNARSVHWPKTTTAGSACAIPKATSSTSSPADDPQTP